MGREPRGSTLERAVALATGRPLFEALDELRQVSRFELDAAYAAATRRRTEGAGYARAAELLEAALLVRRRHPLAGPRWYEGAWTAGVGWVLGTLAFVAVTARSRGVAVALASGVPWLGLAVFQVWLIRRAVILQVRGRVESGGAGARTGFARLSRAVDAVLTAAARDGVDPRDVRAAAAEVSRGVGSTLVSAAALAHAERLLVVDPFSRPRGARQLLAAARDELLDEHPELRRFG